MTPFDDLLSDHAGQVPVDDLIERQALDRTAHALRVAVATAPSPARHRRRRQAARLALAAGLAGVIVVVAASLPRDTGPASASAKVVLERAARAVSRQAWHPLQAGQWLYFRRLSSNPGHNGPATVHANSIDQVWLAANGAARIIQRPGVVTAGDVLLFDQPPRAVRAEKQRQRLGSGLRVMAYRQRYYWGAGPDYQQLIRLPTDPAKLRRWIERNAVDPHSRCAPGASDCNTFSFVESLLAAGPLPPKLCGALYRVIASLPDMRLIGPTHDPLGRPGVAVGYFFKHQPARDELIFNPDTGAFMAERGISLDPKVMHAPVGTVLDWSAIKGDGVVDSPYQPIAH